MATSINPISSGLLTGTQDQAASHASGASGLGGGTANMNTFLQLLVAQIKNQNPLNPTDGTQFVSQLAQFSELEQTIGIRSGVDGLRADLETALAAPEQPGDGAASGKV